jgi:hypothetical protein
LFVQRRLPASSVEIVVRTASDGGFGTFLAAPSASDAITARVVPFPAIARACTVDLIEGGVREQLARSIHDDHVARVGLDGAAAAGLHRRWADLDDDERESSRAAADAIVGRLDAIGAVLVPLRSWQPDDEVFTDDEVERMAADEHARWRREREAAGWVWADRRDDARRTNPLLVDWDALPADAREANRAAIAELPSLLARAGFGIERR